MDEPETELEELEIKIADAIKTFRLSKSMSQTDLARKLDMTTTGYQKLEQTGKGSLNTYRRLRKLYGRVEADKVFFPDEGEI